MGYSEIMYAVQDSVAIITLNRPDRLNALTMTTHGELERAIEEADADDRVRVIVLTGAGRGFCSGDDVRDLFLSPEDEALQSREARLEYLQGKPLTGGGHHLMTINKPSIAAVNGAAVGYGCDLTLLCSMRVASDRARFGEIFLRVGLTPDEGLMLLPKLVGLAKAYELILTTDIIDAQEALCIGLVNKVVPHEQLMDATLELAEKLASKPPIAVRLSMEGIRRGLNIDLPAMRQFLSLAQQVCLETEDHQEGSRAFVEKRPPVFKGR